MNKVLSVFSLAVVLGAVALPVTAQARPYDDHDGRRSSYDRHDRHDYYGPRGHHRDWEGYHHRPHYYYAPVRYVYQPIVPTYRTQAVYAPTYPVYSLSGSVHVR